MLDFNIFICSACAAHQYVCAMCINEDCVHISQGYGRMCTLRMYGIWTPKMHARTLHGLYLDAVFIAGQCHGLFHVPAPLFSHAFLAKPKLLAPIHSTYGVDGSPHPSQYAVCPPRKAAFVHFVCSRNHQHRVKGISMSSFEDEEIKALKNGGNAVLPKPTNRVYGFLGCIALFLHVRPHLSISADCN